MTQTKRAYARLGELIDHMIRALALANSWSMDRTMNEVVQHTGFAEATVYRWRQGRLRPPDETLEVLARIGKDEAGLPRSWGEGLLTAARHPEADRLVNDIWGPKQTRAIPNNLPPPLYTAFVGRQAEMAHLLDLLFPQRGAHLIFVDGIGGVGKTTLVLEVARRCLQASTGEALNPHIPTFDAIVFASAKQQVLTPGGILTVHQAQRALHDIFREIAHTLDRPDITRATPQDQPTRAREALGRQRTLLIVDNMETMEDNQEIMSFLYHLSPQVKVVITTREPKMFVPIRLEQLPEEDSLALIAREAQEKRVALSLAEMREIYRRTGGVPAAMVYVVGRVAFYHSVESVLASVVNPTSDVARFCFEGSVVPLRGQPAHHLLMALAMFPKRPLREAVAQVAGLGADPIAVEDGLAQLQRLSLVSRRERRYTMLPLTHEYALAELAAQPEFEREARERWVRWYLDFAQAHGGYDWAEWQIQFDQLDEEWENLLAVFAWCAAQERYDEVRTFWQDARVLGFASIYGHWHDRLIWLDWLIPAAERRGDWTAAVKAMSEKIFTLALMGQQEQLAEADMLVSHAWDQREHASFRTQAMLAHNIAVLRIRQKNYEDAWEWLAYCEALHERARLDEPLHTRDWISFSYYRAVLLYETRHYDQARSMFEQMIERGKVVNWQRAIIYAQNWLADIAIKESRLDEAERLLHAGLPVAERNKDKRRTAFYKRSFAMLAQAQGNMDEARRWASEALDGFERLGMQPEAQEMQELLRTL